MEFYLFWHLQGLERGIMSSCSWSPYSYEQIRAWTEAHPDLLPKNLVELSRFPIAFRRVIHGVASPETRTQLWSEHYASFMGAGANLTADQEAFLRDATEMLPTFMTGDASEDEWRRFQTRITELFTQKQAAAIFATLGPPEPPEGLPLPDDIPWP